MKTEVLDLDATALRDIFDGVSDLVQSVLPDGRIRFVNKTWLDRLGYTFAEVDGRNIFEIIHPESREHCMYYLRRLLSGEDLGVMETIYVTKSGEPVRLQELIDHLRCDHLGEHCPHMPTGALLEDQPIGKQHQMGHP